MHRRTNKNFKLGTVFIHNFFCFVYWKIRSFIFYFFILKNSLILLIQLRFANTLLSALGAKLGQNSGIWCATLVAKFGPCTSPTFSTALMITVVFQLLLLLLLLPFRRHSMGGCGNFHWNSSMVHRRRPGNTSMLRLQRLDWTAKQVNRFAPLLLLIFMTLSAVVGIVGILIWTFVGTAIPAQRGGTWKVSQSHDGFQCFKFRIIHLGSVLKKEMEW